MSKPFVKTSPQQPAYVFLNSGAGDSVIGGAISSVPSGVVASQGRADAPGERMILGESDAAALSDSSVGTLYGGIYRYVTTKLLSTASAARGHAAFWNTAVAANLYQVTPDEDGTTGIGLFAGVYINTLTKGNSWWIQEAGRVTVQFRAVLTGVPTAGCPVYLAGAGAGADVGEFDVLDGGGAAVSFTQVGAMIQNYIGVAHTAPADDTLSTVNIPMGRSFRW